MSEVRKREPFVKKRQQDDEKYQHKRVNESVKNTNVNDFELNDLNDEQPRRTRKPRDEGGEQHERPHRDAKVFNKPDKDKQKDEDPSFYVKQEPFAIFDYEDKNIIVSQQSIDQPANVRIYKGVKLFRQFNLITSPIHFFSAVHHFEYLFLGTNRGVFMLNLTNLERLETLFESNLPCRLMKPFNEESLLFVEHDLDQGCEVQINHLVKLNFLTKESVKIQVQQHIIGLELDNECVFTFGHAITKQQFEQFTQLKPEERTIDTISLQLKRFNFQFELLEEFVYPMCDFPFQLVQGMVDAQQRLFAFIKGQNTLYLLNLAAGEIRFRAIDLSKFQGQLLAVSFGDDFFKVVTNDLVVKFKLRFMEGQVEVYQQNTVFNKFQLRVKEVKEFSKYKIVQHSSGLVCLQKSEIGGDFEVEAEADYMCFIKKEMSKEMMEVTVDLVL